mmetsp:Transcript_136992/g.438263  ORF Transcript_136992/g.438263 Transcript_136992/m.438263 type:complete len:468 (-) Transcript_136992:8-1411(-)
MYGHPVAQPGPNRVVDDELASQGGGGALAQGPNRAYHRRAECLGHPRGLPLRLDGDPRVRAESSGVELRELVPGAVRRRKRCSDGVVERLQCHPRVAVHQAHARDYPLRGQLPERWHPPRSCGRLRHRDLGADAHRQDVAGREARHTGGLHREGDGPHAPGRARGHDGGGRRGPEHQGGGSAQAGGPHGRVQGHEGSGREVLAVGEGSGGTGAAGTCSEHGSARCPAAGLGGPAEEFGAEVPLARRLVRDAGEQQEAVNRRLLHDLGQVHDRCPTGLRGDAGAQATSESSPTTLNTEAPVLGLHSRLAEPREAPVRRGRPEAMRHPTAIILGDDDAAPQDLRRSVGEPCGRGPGRLPVGATRDAAQAATLADPIIGIPACRGVCPAANSDLGCRRRRTQGRRRRASECSGCRSGGRSGSRACRGSRGRGRPQSRDPSHSQLFHGCRGPNDDGMRAWEGRSPCRTSQA